MAFVSNDPEENKENSQTPSQGPVAPVGGGGAVHLAPSSGISSVGGGGTSGTPPSGTAAPAGGQFASLNTYLTANQGQAAPLAGKITDQIGQQYNTLSGQNDSTLSGINSQIAANATPSQDTTNAIIAKESANPTSFASEPNNVASFQGLLNASYAGPASAEGQSSFTDQQTALNNAIATGNTNTTTAAGRENLLSQNEATPTPGVTALNSAILSQDPNALGSVENAYKPFNNLLTNLNTGASAADQQIAAQQANAAAANQAASGAITNQIGGLNTAVNGELANANASNAAFTGNYNDLQNVLSNGTAALDPNQIAELGLTQDQANALQQQGQLANTSQYMTGHNFGDASATQLINNDQFLTPYAAPAAVNANEVATPEQFQTLMALTSLNNGQLPTGAILDPTASAQAGTYAAPTLSGAFNYNQALQNAQTIQQQERADAQNLANQQTAAADAAHAASKKSGIGNAIKDVINHPLQYAPLNPVTAVTDLGNMAKNAYKNPGTVGPNNINPMPTSAEKSKLAHGGVVKEPIFQKLISNLKIGAH